MITKGPYGTARIDDDDPDVHPLIVALFFVVVIAVMWAVFFREARVPIAASQPDRSSDKLDCEWASYNGGVYIHVCRNESAAAWPDCVASFNGGPNRTMPCDALEAIVGNLE